MKWLFRSLALVLALAPACQPRAMPAAVGPEGGVLTSADGQLQIAVPPGALADDVRITIGRVDEDGRACYELGPPGTAFRVPVAVTLDAPINNYWSVLTIADTHHTRLCPRGG